MQEIKYKDHYNACELYRNLSITHSDHKYILMDNSLCDSKFIHRSLLYLSISCPRSEYK